MSKKTEYKIRNEKFLADLKQEDEIHELPKGILYKVIESGDANGAQPSLRSIVSVHYTGKLINGHVFDDTRRDQCPAAFRLYEVIEGWQIALSQMHKGDRWEIYIPANMGYGSMSMDDIPGNSTLVFDVQLLSIA